MKLPELAGRRGGADAAGGGPAAGTSCVPSPNTLPPKARGASEMKSVAWQCFSGSLSILQCAICIPYTFWSPIEGGDPSVDLITCAQTKDLIVTSF